LLVVADAAREAVSPGAGRVVAGRARDRLRAREARIEEQHAPEVLPLGAVGVVGRERGLGVTGECRDVRLPRLVIVRTGRAASATMMAMTAPFS